LVARSLLVLPPLLLAEPDVPVGGAVVLLPVLSHPTNAAVPAARTAEMRIAERFMVDLVERI